MLADAAGEDEKVHAAEQSNVGADYFADGDGKYIQRELGAWIARAGALFKRFHIALAGGESEEAALMIEQIFNFVGAELLRCARR